MRAFHCTIQSCCPAWRGPLRDHSGDKLKEGIRLERAIIVRSLKGGKVASQGANITTNMRKKVPMVGLPRKLSQSAKEAPKPT